MLKKCHVCKKVFLLQDEAPSEGGRIKHQKCSVSTPEDAKEKEGG